MSYNSSFVSLCDSGVCEWADLHVLCLLLGSFPFVCLSCPMPMCQFWFYPILLLSLRSLLGFYWKSGVVLEGRGGGDWGRVVKEGEFIIGLYYVGKTIFNKKWHLTRKRSWPGVWNKSEVIISLYFLLPSRKPTESNFWWSLQGARKPCRVPPKESVWNVNIGRFFWSLNQENPVCGTVAHIHGQQWVTSVYLRKVQTVKLNMKN